MDALQLALGRIELRQLQTVNSKALRDHEFRAFSQFGEDGIIQYLIAKSTIARPSFVEFGVSNYAESNTRFLLENNNWSGFVIDGSRDNIDFIRSQPYYWRHALTAEHAFVDCANINRLCQEAGFTGEIGILSIDIDGNDYWVWEAIQCVTPTIVVCEYNSLFGDEHQLTVPYDARFSRSRAHYSCLYFGASLPALTALADRRGYALVGSNSAGNNAFFVRRDLLGTLTQLTAKQAYVRANFREARDSMGQLCFLDFDAGATLISDLPLHNCKTGRLITLNETKVRGRSAS